LFKNEAVLKSEDTNRPERPRRFAEKSQPERVPASADADQPSGPSRLQVLAGTALIVAYAVLSQYSSESPRARGLGAVLSLIPILLIIAVVAWRWRRSVVGALVALSTALLLYLFWPVFWPAFQKHYEWADLTQQVGAYGLVAVSFGRSLYGGRVPICTQIANSLRGVLAPAEIAYTRRATFAWAVFYAVLSALILALFFLAPLRVWSVFVNFATFGLIGLMALVDHFLRRRVFSRN
jgi:uncharacterized membrane protein